MIISDLLHFEEVVAELPEVVGGQQKGGQQKKNLGQVVNSDTKEFLLDLGFGNVLGTKVNVKQATGGGNTVKAATGTTKQGNQVKISSSDSTVKK